MSAPSTGANMGFAVGCHLKRFRPDGRTGRQNAAAAGKSAEGHGAGGHEFPEDDGKHEVCRHGECAGVRHPAAYLCQRTRRAICWCCVLMQPHGMPSKPSAPQVKVGLTLSLHDLQAQPGGETFAEAAWQEEFTHYLPYIKEDDFLGVQNYTRTLYGPRGRLPAPEGAELTRWITSSIRRHWSTSFARWQRNSRAN